MRPSTFESIPRLNPSIIAGKTYAVAITVPIGIIAAIATARIVRSTFCREIVRRPFPEECSAKCPGEAPVCLSGTYVASTHSTAAYTNRRARSSARMASYIRRRGLLDTLLPASHRLSKCWGTGNKCRDRDLDGTPHIEQVHTESEFNR